MTTSHTLAVISRRTKTLNQPGLTTQERANRYLCPRGDNRLNDRKHTGVLVGLNSRAHGEFRPGANNICPFDEVRYADPAATRSGEGNLSVTIAVGKAAQVSCVPLTDHRSLLCHERLSFFPPSPYSA